MVIFLTMYMLRTVCTIVNISINFGINVPILSMDPLKLACFSGIQKCCFVVSVQETSVSPTTKGLS